MAPAIPSHASQPTTQSLVDALSVALERAVLLDDSSLVPLAFSRQWEIDPVRRDSILSRGASEPVRRALLAQNIAEAQDVIHTAPDQALEMEARVCMPVRSRGVVLGYIWLLDPDEDLGEDELDYLRRAAGELAGVLAKSERRALPDQADLLSSLRSSDRSIRQAAAEQVRELHLLPEDELVLCLIAAREPGSDLLEAVRGAARRLSAGDALAATQPEGAVLLASLRDPVLRTLGEREVGAWLRTVSDVEIIVGQSATATLTQLDKAFRQAALALRVASSRNREAAVAAWPAMGADRLVAQMPAEVIGDLPPGLAHLLREEPALVATLAAFLATGGEIKATAAALSLHRSGLDYRLRRIEELSGLDLNRGDDRLLADLAIRTEQMS